MPGTTAREECKNLVAVVNEGNRQQEQRKVVLQRRNVTQAADGIDLSIRDQPVELLEDAQIPHL